MSKEVMSGRWVRPRTVAGFAELRGWKVLCDVVV